MEAIVKTVGLSHKYTTAWAVRDININIHKKGIFGLLGSNGAGKSTTMNIICGVLNQSEGEVFIGGINIQKDPIEAKKHIGFLPQVAPLYLDLTVREYLEYTAQLRLMEAGKIPPALEEVMSRCGITHVQNRLLKNLSGGYRQRVGLAQAIIHKPALVILDEPTNGLDPVQITEVRNLIKEIAHEHTVILSSHILSEIQLLCEEIIMIEQGQLVFSDSMDAFNNYIAPQSMLLVFENAPSSDNLSNRKGVTRVERLTQKSFRVFYDGDNAVSETIITDSVQNGWRLTELAIEKNSVDEIFKQLTKKAINN
jgi:ABC-2 type transport system ATP-binding protein